MEKALQICHGASCDHLYRGDRFTIGGDLSGSGHEHRHPRPKCFPAYESRYGHDLLTQAYDERELNSIVVAVELPASYEDSRDIELMKAYTDEIRMMPGVKQVESYLSIGRGSVEEASKYLSREDIRQRWSDIVLLGEFRDRRRDPGVWRIPCIDYAARPSVTDDGHE